MAKDYYTPPELAKALGVSSEVVQMWCRNGKIAASRVVGRWRISRAEGDRLIAGGKGAPETKQADGLALSY